MKKKHLFLGCAVLLLLAGIFTVPHFIGQKPLKDLSDAEIEHVDVELFPPGQKIPLTAEETAQLLPLLHNVVTYQKDNSYVQYDGQLVLYTILKKDGTAVTVMAYNPFVVLDGVGYRTEYDSCERLSQFANKMAQKD